MSYVAIDSIPNELKLLPQWVCWRKAYQDGRLTKIPINPYTGEWASTTASDTWGTLTDACEAVRHHGCDGIGFVFTHDDPYAGVDLDQCRDAETGVLEPWAQHIVDSIQTFTEVSTSGTGVHCILRGHLPGARCRKGKTEMYDHERYFVMTGNCLPDFSLTIEERQSELEALYGKIFLADKDRTDATASKPCPPLTHDLSDDEIIKKAHKAQAKDREKFKRLWAGDDSGYESRSEADAALCALLAFWTCHDPEWIDQLFRQSGLYRDDKWERQDYREDTIAFAINGVDNYYDPNYSGSLSSSEQETERASKALEKLKQRQAEWPLAPQDEPEPITADKPSHTENESQASSEPVHTRPTVTLEYFEDVAQEPGHKALCLPPHFGTLEALQRFICENWYRGFVVAIKKNKQAERLALDLISLSARLETCQAPGGSLRDHILVLHGNIDEAILQEYFADPKSLLQRYPIIVVPHQRLLMEPPDFFLHLAPQDETDQARTREFVIILERPQVKSLTLPDAEYDLICLATDGTDNIDDAIQSIQAKWEDDNPIVRQSSFDMFLRLAQINPDTDEPTELIMERATHRLRVVFDARKNGTLHQSQKGYTAYMHPGLLENPHVWIVDGAADLTLKDAKYWAMVKEPDYDYHLVCPCSPIIPDIDMIDRNLKKALTTAEGDIGQAYQIVRAWMGTILELLDSLAHQHTRVLVVVWKDFKGTASLKPLETTPLVEGNTLEAVENGLLRFFALTMKERHPGRFEFSPYQPGTYSLPVSKAKSIDAVVFIGKFFLPQSAIEDFNRANGSHTDRYLCSLAEVVKQTFRSRCQFGEPVTISFTPDWSKDDIQRFLVYTNARDLEEQPLSMFTQDELLEQKLKGMGLSEPRRKHISKIVKAYPEFEDIWKIKLPTQEVKEILGKSNIRDIREMLENWKNKGIHITLL